VGALAVLPAVARRVGSGDQDRPLGGEGVENTTAASAVVLVPDGSSITQVVGAEAERWYAARLEAGKGYLVEAMHSGRDRTANDITMGIYESDGTTTFGDFLTCDVDTNSAAPSMQANSAASTMDDGKRCTVAVSTASVAKLVLVKLSGFYAGSPLMVRIRETTVYARYTVNSYNMYVAVHNPSAEPVSGYVVFWPENLTTNVASSYVGFDMFTLSGYGSTQFAHTANQWATPGNRGQVRIYTTSGTDVHVQVYAFSPSANNYLFFAPQRVNGGSGNAW
jgi:hypothetical protein